MSIRTFFANAFEQTLAEEMGPNDLEAVVVSLGGAPSSPAYLVIEPDVPSRREYILFDGTFSDSRLRTSVIGNRYLADSAQSSNITHPVGSIVRMSPLRQHFDDLHEQVEDRLATSSHTKSLHDSLGIGHGGLSERDLSESHPIAAITNLQSTLDSKADDPHHHDAAYVEVSGDAMTGNLDMAGHQVNAAGVQHTSTPTVSGATAIDFNDDSLTHELNGDVTYSTVNRAAGRRVLVRVVSDAEIRTLSFPAGWVFVSEKPTEIAASKTGILALEAYGADESDVVAAWAVEE